MQNEDNGKIAETKVHTNNNTSLPAAFRHNEDVDPGDTLDWRHETYDDGDRWIIAKQDDNGTEEDR